MIRTILQLGHPVLRQEAKELSETELLSSSTQALIDDLIETMHDAEGAGLAAPQVGESLRVCVAEVKSNPRYPEMAAIPLRVWVNPRVEVVTETPRVTMYEGCLSVAGVRGQVERPGHIRVHSLDREGREQCDEFLGASASVAQHEIDHLDGCLFLDRADPRTLSFLEEFVQFVPPEERLIVRGMSPQE